MRPLALTTTATTATPLAGSAKGNFGVTTKFWCEKGTFKK